jgi:hypothetical protein
MDVEPKATPGIWPSAFGLCCVVGALLYFAVSSNSPREPEAPATLAESGLTPQESDAERSVASSGSQSPRPGPRRNRSRLRSWRQSSPSNTV